ncbi:MAG: YeeE/YedE family protein, partial [Betaproteobacteria bacterium]|nr:YeeE/YedE family protein [Betaproteobacteria bacterium]
MSITQFLIVATGLLLAGTMGFAIQRGATCTVAAVDEIVHKRRAHRLASMVEASIWVVAGLLIAQALHLLGKTPSGYAVSVYTIAGGVLLGVGAYVNQACVFGAIARLGSGEWAYVLTPVGFYVGCLTVGTLLPMPQPTMLTEPSPILQASTGALVLVTIFVLWRAGRPLVMIGTGSQAVRKEITERVWSPHAATAVIGITFVILLVMMGAWAYTDVLAELAQGMAADLGVRVLLLLALLAGAMIGGWTAGRFRATPIAGMQLAKCFLGGLLMGWGSLLIPGSNDGLILLGMPLLWPYAWVAFLTMC